MNYKDYITRAVYAAMCNVPLEVCFPCPYYLEYAKRKNAHGQPGFCCYCRAEAGTFNLSGEANCEKYFERRRKGEKIDRIDLLGEAMLILQDEFDKLLEQADLTEEQKNQLKDPIDQKSIDALLSEDPCKNAILEIIVMLKASIQRLKFEYCYAYRNLVLYY